MPRGRPRIARELDDAILHLIGDGLSGRAIHARLAGRVALSTIFLRITALRRIELKPGESQPDKPVRCTTCGGLLVVTPCRKCAAAATLDRFRGLVRRVAERRSDSAAELTSNLTAAQQRRKDAIRKRPTSRPRRLKPE